MGLSILLFFVLPMLLPALMPSLRSNPTLTKLTQPQVITATYKKATQEDVDARVVEMAAYQKLPVEEQEGRSAPVPIELGQAWSKSTELPAKSIFWTRGVVPVVGEDGETHYEGKGMINLFLLAIDPAGWDLSKNDYALNETLRVLFRIFFPFVILIAVSLLSKRSKEEVLSADRMAARLMTPLADTPKMDDDEVEQSHTSPERFNHLKLFGPKSSWQFCKWNRVDSVGFLINVAVVFSVVGSLFFFFQLGA